MNGECREEGLRWRAEKSVEREKEGTRGNFPSAWAAKLVWSQWKACLVYGWPRKNVRYSFNLLDACLVPIEPAWHPSRHLHTSLASKHLESVPGMATAIIQVFASDGGSS